LILGLLPPPDDLTVDLSSNQSFQVLERPGIPIPQAPAVKPDSLLARVEVHDLPAVQGPGLNLRTWRVEYGHRWEREVTLPILAGPFDQEGADVCGFAVWLGAGLFDTSSAGAGLKDAVHRRLAEMFPRTVEGGGIEIAFPAVERTIFRIELDQGRAHITAAITLLDGTYLSARFDVRLASRGGSPVVERIGRVTPEWTGPTREQAQQAGADKGAAFGTGLGALAGFILGGPLGALLGGGLGAAVGSEYGEEEANALAEEKAQEEIAGKIDAALAQLSFGLESLRKPLSLLPGRPSDQVFLKLAANPSLSSRGISLPLCASVRVAGPKVDKSIPGSAHVAANAASVVEASVRGSDAMIELTIDANGINQALYFLWQSGLLRELGRSSAVLDALPESLRSLAFDVTGFDPALPPTTMAGRLSSRERGMPLLFGDISIGSWGNRRVTGHAAMLVDINPVGDDLELSGVLHHMTVNCVEAEPDGHARLTPCLSDLLPAARETLHETPLRRRFPGGEILGRLPRDPFQSLHVAWSNLKASVHADPPRLSVRVNASLTGKP
jgi:hypothetical protein